MACIEQPAELDPAPDPETAGLAYLAALLTGHLPGSHALPPALDTDTLARMRWPRCCASCKSFNPDALPPEEYTDERGHRRTRTHGYKAHSCTQNGAVVHPSHLCDRKTTKQKHSIPSSAWDIFPPLLDDDGYEKYLRRGGHNFRAGESSEEGHAQL